MLVGIALIIGGVLTIELSGAGADKPADRPRLGSRASKMTSMTDSSLIALAERMGVATAYHDWVGNFNPVDRATVIAVLAALGVHAETEDECAAAQLEQDRRYWSRPLPTTVVARSGTATPFWVHVNHGAPADVGPT